LFEGNKIILILASIVVGALLNLMRDKKISLKLIAYSFGSFLCIFEFITIFTDIYDKNLIPEIGLIVGLLILGYIKFIDKEKYSFIHRLFQWSYLSLFNSWFFKILLNNLASGSITIIIITIINLIVIVYTVPIIINSINWNRGYLIIKFNEVMDDFINAGICLLSRIDQIIIRILLHIYFLGLPILALNNIEKLIIKNGITETILVLLSIPIIYIVLLARYKRINERKVF